MFADVLEGSNVKLKHDLSIQVLTQGSWPENEITNVQIPSELQLAKHEFEKFHTSKYPGKVLHWVLGLGDAELTLQPGTGKKYVLIATNY